MSRLRLSLSTKLLALVTVPLLMQVGFLTWLALVQQDVERELETTSKAKQISHTINLLSKDIYAAAASLGRSEALHEEASEEVFRELEGSIQQHFAALKEQTKDIPATASVVGTCEVAMLKVFTLIRQLKDVTLDPRPRARLQEKQMWREIRMQLHTVLLQGMMDLAEQQKSVTEESTQAQIRLRRQMYQATLASAASTVLLAIVIAFYMVKSLSRRLQILNDNNTRLASNQPLHPQLAGDDDVARIDQTFHLMADTLAEAKRREQEAQALRREIMAMVSHDLRTPLSTLNNVFELLEQHEQANLSKTAQEYVNVGTRNVDRMLGLINDLLDIEKIDAGQLSIEKRKVSLEECFGALESTMSVLAETKNVKLQAPETDIFVIGDEEKIDRILANLVSNAIKFSPDGGSIAVTAERNGGGFAVVSVSDQGVGIPPDKLNDVFGRYQQLPDQPAAKGSGLGLAICKAFVEMHGGTIWVESQVGEGSAFKFTLPLA